MSKMEQDTLIRDVLWKLTVEEMMHCNVVSGNI